MEYQHKSVLLKEVLNYLNVSDGEIYIDATLGGGGHFLGIIENLKRGLVIGMDVDEDAISKVKEDLLKLGFLEKDVNYFFKEELKVFLLRENFKNIVDALRNIAQHNIGYGNQKARGVVFDLGASSYQIDDASKGFSYMHDSPLDMRMDKRLSVKAEDLVNGLYEKELADLLTNYGEEAFAKRIAKGIIERRKKERIVSSKVLCEVIKRSVPFFYKNPYAKTFQALRIGVNDELGSLKEAVNRVDDILEIGGRVVFISFHSLEDRIIKEKFEKNPSYKRIDDVIKPDIDEINENKRSRSAKLRCYEKI